MDIVGRLASRDLNALPMLQALLEEANVTRAGKRVGVGQSAMSTALARLRVQFGDQLLVRVGRDLELTPFASELLPYVRQAVHLLRGALRTEEEFEPATAARSIRISSSDFMGVELAPVLARMRDEAPDLRFALTGLPDAPAADGQDLLQCDFVVTARGVGAHGRSETLLTDRYVCLLDRANPVVGGGRLEWADFVRLPLALAAVGRHQVHPVMAHLQGMGYLAQPRVTAAGLLAIPAAVAGTALVTIVPERFARRCAAQQGLVVVDASFLELPIVETLWWHAWHDDDAGHRWVRGRIVDGIRDGSLLSSVRGGAS